MFRFYELYSLYLKKMSSSCGTSPGWCLCEKLPRSILHIAPTPEVWCDVCGRRRRPRACLTSSSDEEERAAELRQQLLAERRRNDQEARRGLVRVKVAMSAKKPKPRRKSHCNKCMVGMVCGQQLRSNHNNSNPNGNNTNHGINSNNNNNKSKTYTGRFGCYRKPQRLSLTSSTVASPSKRHNAVEAEVMAEPQPSAPPPPPSPSPPAGESLWVQTADDMPNLMAFAHEVFNRRRPRACLTSSSDEEERAAELRQQLLAERRRNDQEARRGLVRVKVAMSAKKPKPRRKSHCNKCMVGMVCGQQLRSNHNNSNPNGNNTNHGINSNNNNNKSKTYTGRFGCYRKPQRLSLTSSTVASPSKRHNAVEAEVMAEPQPSAPPPPPSPSPPAGESLWVQTADDMPNLVAFAHEVFNRPLHMRQCQSSFYDNLFVSDLIPLDKPITDATGGAISKRRRIFGRSHCSQPLPPLSHVLCEIMTKQQQRAKGGGLTAKVDEAHSATQFSPFESYEGPSEDALVVESARQMLRQPKALHIGERDDLPNTRLSSFESEPSSDCSSSSPFDVPSAPPTDNLRHGYTMGAPLRLHDMMKTVAQSGISDSSVSSSSTDSISSHKSDSSALPPRSRGGEEPLLLEKPAEPDISHISIMEKIIWLMEQKPEPNAADHPMIMEPAPDLIEDSHTDSVKGLLQFMESLHIDSKLIQNNLEEKLLTTTVQECGQTATQEPNPTTADAPTVPPDKEHHSNSPPNDMSNESHLNFTNKSAGDAKYLKGLSGVGGNASSSSSSMWSIISGFFGNGTKHIDPRATGNEELQPLRGLQSNQRTQYGATDRHRSSLKEIATSNCQGKQRMAPKVPNNLHSNCKKCGRIRCTNKPQNHQPKSNPVSSESNSASSIYQTAQTAADSQQNNDQTKSSKATGCFQEKSRRNNQINCKLTEDFRSLTNCRRLKESNGIPNINDNSKLWKTNKQIVKNAEEESKKEKKKFNRTVSPKHINNNPKKLFNNNLNDGMNQLKTSDNEKDKSEKLKKDLSKTSRNVRHVPVDSPKQKINRPIIAKDVLEDSKKLKLKTKRTTKPKEQQIGRKIETKTSSTNFESCFGTVRSSTKYSNLKPGIERRDLQLQELLQQLKVVKPSSPKVVHTVKVVGLVQYECSEILRPKMLYSREIIVGKLNKYSLRQPKSAKSLELLEFRTPDIQKTESNDNNLENDWDVTLESSLSIDKSGEPVQISIPDIQKTSLKRKQLPVWPAQPSRSRKQYIKYNATQVEPTYSVGKDNVQVEKPRTGHYDTPDTNKTRRKKRIVRWIVNNVVQNQINEMMTKPIQLLS